MRSSGTGRRAKRQQALSPLGPPFSAAPSPDRNSRPRRALRLLPLFWPHRSPYSPMTRPPRGLCAAGGTERTIRGAGVDRPLQLRCGPLRGARRRGLQGCAHPRQSRAALAAACAAVCAWGNRARPPSEKSSKRRPEAVVTGQPDAAPGAAGPPKRQFKQKRELKQSSSSNDATAQAAGGGDLRGHWQRTAAAWTS